MITESIGVLATICLVASFIFNGESKIRVANSVGAVLFVAYGILIGAWSTAIANLIIVCINIHKLHKEEKR